MSGATRRTLDAILDAVLDVLAELPAGGEQEAADRDHLALVLAEEELLPGRREQARRDPLWAGRVLGVTSYLEGPAGTADERAEGLRRHLEQVPDALDGLAAGLEEVPAAFREAAADVLCGYASFYRTGVAALAGARWPSGPRPRSSATRPGPRWPSAASSWSTAASCPCPRTSRRGWRPPRRTCAAPWPSTTPRGRSTRCPSALRPGPPRPGLHLRAPPSRVATVLWNDVLGEGWAHYCEEAAFDAGFRAGDPEAEVAMRTDALVRAARAEFETTAGLDPDHARLEAVRGTWDPGYFSCTLGKLEILALRGRAGGDLGAFHDRLLSTGTPPPPS